MTIPGQLREVWLHDGHATVTHGSRYGVPLDVLTTTVTHGYLGHGPLNPGPVTALQVWCDTRNSTAAAELAEGIAVTELFYRPSNPDCCPSGRAVTIWKWTGRTFIPGPHQDHDQIARTLPARQAWLSPSSPGPSVGSTLTRLCAAITR